MAKENVSREQERERKEERKKEIKFVRSFYKYEGRLKRSRQLIRETGHEF